MMRTRFISPGRGKKEKYFSIWLLLGGFPALAALVLALCLIFDGGMPDNVGRTLTGEEKEEVIGRNSPLTDYVFLSPNASFPREGRIEKITIHHMAGNLNLEALGERFSNRDRQVSANYAIDSSGRVALYVEEANRAWTSSSRDNDNMAVTVEVANDEIGGDWHVSDEAYEALIQLCADICRRNGIEALEYTGDEQGNLTTHKMFTGTECPGPYLEGRLEEIAGAVNRLLNGD
ncbi:MAG: N-acetylmuramoyl-L-alanine amidase [bacterium]|nr:N-acetylmuramoyl-L-alanine amidase [bacterium]